MKAKKKREKVHKPVLVDGVVRLIDLKCKAHLNKQAYLIDATVGTGGHLLEFLKYNVKVLGIDADPAMLKIAKKRLESSISCKGNKIRGDYQLVCANYYHLDKVAKEYGFGEVDAVLFDLGVSSLQLTSPERGFSFVNPEALLDMRIDVKRNKVKAADLLNLLSFKQLISLFAVVYKKGEAMRMAKAVVDQRKIKAFREVADLLEIAKKVVRVKSKTHSATKAFLALRMAVNSELENLREALPKACALLKKGGRLAVISFHSGEDAIVKAFMKEKINLHQGKEIGNNPITTGLLEISNNPRSRSAKLRVMEKI